MRLAPKLTEKQFMAQVVRLAKLCGWILYHTHDSRRSEPGFPDLVLAHPKRKLVIFAELKTDAGKLTDAQDRWLDVLHDCGERVRVWRPADWADIESLLMGRTGL